MTFSISVAAVIVFLTDLQKFLHVQDIIPLYVLQNLSTEKNFFLSFVIFFFIFFSCAPLVF